MGVTGTIVTFRPQIAALMSPAAVGAAGCREATDWNQAEREIEGFAGSRINRVYFSDGGDPRVQLRMEGESEKIYNHVTYDGCAAKVLGRVNLGWMYWTVDLHHNLLAEHRGRWWVGVIGVVLLLMSLGGLLLWLLARPNLFTAFRVETGRSGVRTSLDLHRASGLAIMPLLILPAFTGIWLCYGQLLRSVLANFATVSPDIRPKPRPRNTVPIAHAGLGDVIAAARKALPDGQIREIRMPEGRGTAQVRMWRAGDFRSLGNNVVFVDGASASVLAVDLYQAKPGGNRFIQAMAGLHYGEWGGLVFRTIYGLAALATVLLFITGFLIWWWPKARRSAAAVRVPPEPVRQAEPAA
jgi:uncharacterized iron-regulated membrane protein